MEAENKLINVTFGLGENSLTFIKYFDIFRVLVLVVLLQLSMTNDFELKDQIYTLLLGQSAKEHAQFN